ncbi:hypothetical protein NDU88_002437 [Pleurodeles waltl]|uniref:Uncharacterized protein n=1 Tax=Pleurodeles waltl TaxID=8319 RepID=A0AAV7QCW2_PLEWA|nr:hypothetical protein NDU88_002437 [Pleurodeles waltl]
MRAPESVRPPLARTLQCRSQLPRVPSAAGRLSSALPPQNEIKEPPTYLPGRGAARTGLHPTPSVGRRPLFPKVSPSFRLVVLMQRSRTRLDFGEGGGRRTGTVTSDLTYIRASPGIQAAGQRDTVRAVNSLYMALSASRYSTGIGSPVGKPWEE